ncbi:MAG TPA: TadE/TadG family type IV pilus assembly protein [Sphingomonas sp.]|nr:TadE/TadG family type IV pilus assembly protein [Sphingomonas sp.]
MRRPPLATLRALLRDRRGVTIIEFAIVAPVMLLMLMGLGDLLYQVYAKEILSGAIQKAGRDSGIQGGAQATAQIDGKVLAMIDTIMITPTPSCAVTPAAGTYCSKRFSYANFAVVGPERFTDVNANNQRDAGECYDDVNGNSQWDAEPGATGQGGANDVTLYTFTVTYPRLFPMAGMMGWSKSQTITAQTLIKNQPYATQPVTTVKQRCT